MNVRFRFPAAMLLLIALIVAPQVGAVPTSRNFLKKLSAPEKSTLDETQITVQSRHFAEEEDGDELSGGGDESDENSEDDVTSKDAPSEDDGTTPLSDLPDDTPTPTAESSPLIPATPTPFITEMPPMDDDNDSTSEESDPDSPEPKSASPTSVLGTTVGGVSVLALVGIALAILAPAVLIYWGIRRRNRAYVNMPAAADESNTYRSRGSFTVE